MLNFITPQMALDLLTMWSVVLLFYIVVIWE